MQAAGEGTGQGKILFLLKQEDGQGNMEGGAVEGRRGVEKTRVRVDHPAQAALEATGGPATPGPLAQNKAM